MEAVPTRHRTTIVYAVTAAIAIVVGMLSPDVLMPLCAAAIALLGVPHGSLDLHLLSTKQQRMRELAVYIGSIALVLLVWYMLPTGMLVVFLLNSAWHFGDCDLRMSGRFRVPAALVYGAAVLLLVVDPADATVTWILRELVGQQADTLAAFDLAIARIIASLAVIMLPLIGSSTDRPSVFLRSVSVVVVAALVPSLLAFTWYFAVVHAWTSMDSLRHHLDDEHPWTWTRTLRAAAPLTVLTYAGVAVAGLAFSGTAVLTMLFVALSALTVPHSRLFHRVYA